MIIEQKDYFVEVPYEFFNCPLLDQDAVCVKSCPDGSMKTLITNEQNSETSGK